MALTFIVDINPFTFEVDIIARMYGVEDRTTVYYDPTRMKDPIEFKLESGAYLFWLEYDQAVIVRVTDSEGTEQRVKPRFTGLK